MPNPEQLAWDAAFEIKYKMACARLGYTDPEILDYVKKELLTERQSFCETWLQ